MGYIGDKNHRLLFFWCIKGKSTCFSPWKLSALQVLFTPGILLRARNASPAKSFAVNTSWSITVNKIIAPGTRHCSSVTELCKKQKRKITEICSEYFIEFNRRVKLTIRNIRRIMDSRFFSEHWLSVPDNWEITIWVTIPQLQTGRWSLQMKKN